MRFHRRRAPRFREEIRLHRDRLIEDFLASGLGRKEAERRAFLEFGSVDQIDEAVMDVRGRWLDDFAKDLRYAVRALLKSPGFAAVAALSLALGIGANTAIFSLVNAVMLRPLPVGEPGRLVQLARLRNGNPASLSYPLFEYFRDNVRSLSGAFAMQSSDRAITIDGVEEFVATDFVSGAYFEVLGIKPVTGRLLEPRDDKLSHPSSAAVISDRFWQRRFDRSPSAIGKTFALRDRVFTIVGVTPASHLSARAGSAPDVTLPLLLMMSDEQRLEPTNNSLGVVGRLKPGSTVEQANAEVQVLWTAFLQSQVSGAPEKSRAEILAQRAAALPAPDGINPIRTDTSGPLLVLMGIVGLMLMLACVNLSGLLLARAASRQREISIRLAMGASRGRLLRQLLTESLLLAVIGGGVGLVSAGWFSEWLFALVAGGRTLAFSVSPDWRVFAFTAAICVAACVVAGLAPALHAVRTNLNPVLKVVRAHGPARLGKLLVVTQIAISMILVVAATLFVGTLITLQSVERGFDSNGVIVVNVRSSQPYPAAGAMTVQRALVERLRTLPGVRSVSAVATLPIGGGLWQRAIRVDGYTFRSDESDDAGFNVIGPEYFATIGTPVLHGREFSDRDAAEAPYVTIVNESFAKYFFGSSSPLGRRVTSLDITYEIVGVVRDAKYQTLRAPVLRTMYIPWSQRDGEQPSSYRYLVRAEAGSVSSLIPLMERTVRSVEPSLHLRTATTYDTLIARSLASERTMATLGGLFGILGLIIAAMGIFGVLAFQVARRTNELGVRMALGASRAALIGLVLRDITWMLAAGIAIGALGARMTTGLVGAMLFGFTPTDPRVFAMSAITLLSAAFLAGWLPARRASRVDPLVVLRHE
jgi:putative ABC transport system permease protein